MDDVVIVGGGIIGASTAFFLSKEGRIVRVFERAPTYKKASFPLSLGGFRRQFFQKENILLGKFAKEFMKSKDIKITFHDERYSSDVIYKELRKNSLSKDKIKKKIDQMAASYILQGFLDNTKHT